MKLMKILITHELFPPDVAGGGERLVLKLAKHLKSKGHSVKVVTSGDPDIKSYGGVETVRIPANRYLMNVLSLFTILRHAWTADIIQTSSGNMCFPSFIAARLLNKPICCWVHHIFGKYWKDIRGQFVGRIFEIGERIILTRKFDRYVFQNESSKKIGIGMGVRPDKIVMITPGVDYRESALEGVEHKYKHRRDRNVLFVGNFSMDRPTIKTKGVEYLMEAAGMMPDVDFILVGNFKEKIEHPKNVSIAGLVSRKSLIRLYGKACVFVCSSLNEGFSLALLEAMASGCAIVSTIDIGQVGKKVSPKDPKALADAIRHYIENPSKARADGDRNRKLARMYSWDRFYSSFEQLYKNLNKYRNK